MKKFQKVFACICACACLMASFAVPAYAADPANPETSQTQTGTARIDVIVIKYRLYNGVLQYRRWNETRDCWVDPEWINVPT